MTIADIVSFTGEAPVDALSFPPGAELAGTLESLIPFALGDGELIDALRAFRREASWAQAGELAVIAELARRRPAGAYKRLVDGSSFTGEFLVDEVESALTLTGVSAAYLVELALSLSERLPGTLEALRAGLIDQAKAKVIAQGTAAVSPEVAGLVERQVLDGACTQTTSELRSKVARAVIAADPDAADKRRKAVEAQRDVHCHEERDGSGTATISGRHLPADQAVAAANRLNAIARAFKADGDGRRLGAIRADVLLAMMLGLLPAELQPPIQPEDPPTPCGERVDDPSPSPLGSGDAGPKTAPGHTEPRQPRAAHASAEPRSDVPPSRDTCSPVGEANRNPQRSSSMCDPAAGTSVDTGTGVDTGTRVDTAPAPALAWASARAMALESRVRGPRTCHSPTTTTPTATATAMSAQGGSLTRQADELSPAAQTRGRGTTGPSRTWLRTPTNKAMTCPPHATR